MLWLYQSALWVLIGACGLGLYTGMTDRLEQVSLRICGTLAIVGLGIISAIMDLRKEDRSEG